jgi:hypothetical protein
MRRTCGARSLMRDVRRHPNVAIDFKKLRDTRCLILCVAIFELSGCGSSLSSTSQCYDKVMNQTAGTDWKSLVPEEALKEVEGEKDPIFRDLGVDLLTRMYKDARLSSLMHECMEAKGFTHYPEGGQGGGTQSPFEASYDPGKWKR